jgi:hypothetical protein
MLSHPPPRRPTIDLSGAWELRPEGEEAWRAATVPGCWEQAGVPMTFAGPCWYRRTVTIPAEWAGQRIWLRFGAVSYHAEVFVDRRPAGEHTGLWDAFAIEITGLVTPGADAELSLRVEKPAGLTAGPDSARLPGRFPLRETLAGFLPYVWGHMFGGIWQGAELVATGPAVFEDLLVRGAADGTVEVTAATSAPAEVTIEIRDPNGMPICLATENTESTERVIERHSVTSVHSVAKNLARFSLSIPEPQPWSPDSPALYEARLSLAGGDERVVRFGLRTLRAEGSTITLNGEPIYPRMALSWGWYPEALHSNPGPARVRADFARLKQLGYNGVKLCLWFPPQRYFDLANELGMLLWVELPMWIPQPSAFFRAQTPAEYDRLMRLARGHPSVILYTLGCELSRVVDAQLLGPLFELVKRHAGAALVRDNSGSGEAYGGLLDEYAEFYDHHFYAELQHFRGLLDYFAPRGRAPQPWLFGEFCDYDAFRDPEQLQNQEPRTENLGDLAGDATVLGSGFSGSTSPWWLSDDPETNPQGARWQYDLPFHERRLREAGLLGRGAELERISERQGLWHRKYTLELVRLYREVSGYVVTGEADTPITSAGMWDHADRLKFDPAEFRGFNADLVLLAAWDRRRQWSGGGDRAAPWDTWSYPAGATVRPHLVASHYGRARGPARLAWRAGFAGEPAFAHGEAQASFALAPGDLRELAVAEFAAPQVGTPRQALLEAELEIDGERAHNSWPLWIFPPSPWARARGIALYDPLGRLGDFERIAPGLDERPKTNDELSQLSSFVLRPSSTVVITTLWVPELHEWIERGGRAILVQPDPQPPGPLPVAALPFWREALRLAEPHPAWGDFPLDDALAMQLFGCAADQALDLAGYAGEWRPILRRLDTRTMRLHEYAAELRLGAGSAIVTTLRLSGGQGAQPAGIARSTAAAYLLWCWASYLAST